MVVRLWKQREGNMASKEMIIEVLNIRQLKRPVDVTGLNLIP